MSAHSTGGGQPLPRPISLAGRTSGLPDGASGRESGSLLDVLRLRARTEPDRVLYTFLENGESAAEELTCGELERRARAVAAALRRAHVPGDRALLLFPPGLDFIAAFFGCLLAGVVAVPAYPPRPRREDARLQAVARDAAPAVVLTSSALLATARQAAGAGLAGLEWLATDSLSAGEWDGDDPLPDDLALLQYTSGSTSLPKGVMVRHRNLAHNSRMIRDAFGQDEHSVVVGWLPLYHDMGLIGNVLQPLYCGGECVLMSPMAFLQRPRRWLEAVSRYRGTTSGGPDFAYDLCARKIGPQEREGLDLSSWTVAFNGAEPVRAETLERFAAAFAGNGFRREAFYPCYGLAEATLFVSGGTRGAGHRELALDAAALERHEAVPPGDAPARRLVSCGLPWLGQQVRIADPETGEERRPGQVGEIWVAGGSVAAGYWGRPEDSGRDFDARLAGEPESPAFLRTGDLGFLESGGGDLFVTGRLKDLIILRGRNHYPQDLERTAEGAHPLLRAAGSAAFAVDAGDRERLVLVCEVERRGEATGEAAAAVRQAVAEAHEIQVDEVVLIRTGTLPRTSSGKVRRRACREMWAAGELAVVGVSTLDREDEAAPAVTGGGLRRELAGLAPEERQALLEAELARRVAGALRVAPSSLGRDVPLTRFGLDSLALIELQHGLETDFGTAPSLSTLLSGASLAEVAAELAGPLDEATAEEPLRPLDDAGDTGAEHPLSYGQRALWFLEQLRPGTTAFVIAGAAEVQGELDGAALRRALARLAERHPALRTAFRAVGGQPVQSVLAHADVELVEEDASEWSEEVLRESLRAAVYAPFDLEAGRTLRVGLFHRGSGAAVLWLTMHHLVSDLWSVSILWRDLEALYREETGGPAAALPPVALRYTDCVRWQERRLAGAAGERLWDYWSRRLGGRLPVLDLPTDRPRPPVQTHHGAAEMVRLPADWAAQVKELARSHGATFYATLLAGFQALLHRYTGQEDLLVGSSTTGRGAAGMSEVVGYFINPVALRADLSDAPTFGSFLARTRDTAVEAFAHQEYPFPLLAERLQPEREPSRSPVFQVYFVLERAQHESARALAAFALNEPGGRLELAGTPLVSLRLPERSAQFDLMLLLAEPAEGLSLALEYNADLFDAATARRMLGHFRTLVGAAAADPGRWVSGLPLLAEEERAQLLGQWSAPQAAVDAGRAGRCLHELFAEQARRTPRAVAAVHETDELTYAELARRAGQLAGHLRSLGVRPDVLVGLCVERSLDVVVGILGILEAGGAYLPLDPSYPRERLSYMLADARVPLLVTRKALADRLPAGAARVVALDDPLPAPSPAADAANTADTAGVLPENLAYAIYTSGSTGRPKGTLISHANVVRLFRAVEPWFGFGPQDVWTCFHSYAFDFSVWEIWGALLYGGRVVIVPESVSRSPVAFHELLATERVTVLNQTPSAFGQLLAAEEDEGPAGPALRAVIFGGEALQPGSLKPWFDRHGDRTPELVNMYGITETTVHVTYRLLRARDAAPGAGAESVIGRPIPDLGLYLLDRNGELVPAGVPGEIHVGGAGLARGYLDRPALTAERFVPDPFGSVGAPGSRLYKSGDLARWLPDGDLDYLGRADNQVKVRGFRIELGEIEATLAGHPAVAQAVVMARDAAAGTGATGRRLVAYVVPHDRAALKGLDLRVYVGERLPSYMVPAAVVALDAFPLTPTGKVDRRALPSPEASLEEVEVGVAPRTATEAALAEIWADLLSVPEVSVTESFFVLGGHSLLATQMISRVREAMKVELAVAQVFETPTVAALAAAVDAARGDGAAPPAPAIVPVPRSQPLPLSFAQTRLWFLHQLAPALPVYNEPVALRLSGELAGEALERALGEILRRHEALRTGFVELGGEPVQVIVEAAALPLPRVDLAALPEERREPELRRLGEEMARVPFALGRPPLCHALLLRAAPQEHALVLVLHHIASDGWSIGVFLRELAALYNAFRRGEASPLPELEVQYADFAVWQREWLRGEVLERQLAYWRRLAGVPALELPTDRPRTSAPARRGACLATPLSADLVADLEGFSRRRGATLFMTLAAGFAALLHRYTGEEDFAFGTPIANRNRAEIEGLIGFFVNTLPLRLDLSGTPGFGDLLRRTRREVLGASEHQDLPFEKLAAELQLGRNLGHNPLYQTVLAFQRAPLGEAGGVELDGLALRMEHLHTGTAKFDLTLAVIGGSGAAGGGEDLLARLEYDAGLFDEVHISRLAGHLQSLLRAAAAAPETPCAALPILSPAEMEQLLGLRLDARPEGPPAACLHELFAAWARRTPDAVAVVCGEVSLTYGALAARAGRLARRLTALGVGPETRVGLCLERSADLVVAILAVLEAGGAYVPLDPDYPAERLAFLLADAAAPVVLAQERTRGRLGAAAAHDAHIVSVDEDEPAAEDVAAGPGVPVDPDVDPDNAAYVIYTSGSTGVPKGVVVSHASVVRLFTATDAWFGFGTDDVWTLFHSYAFDFSVWELWGALLYGGRLVVVPYWVSRSPEAFHDLLRAERVTVLNQTPSAFRPLAEVDRERGTPAGTPVDLALRAVIFGGEALEPAWLEDWLGRRGDESPLLVNMYGITETTVHVTYRPISRTDLEQGRRSPVGVPIPDLQVYVLDRFRALLPLGLPGEMYVGGPGLARGYLGRPALTAERFVPHPFPASPGERLYRSGDLARRRRDGELEYLGRIDHQVKVRGFRIELGEIEAALARHPAVRQAVVVVRPGPDQAPSLVGYLVPRSGGAPAAAELRAFLARTLPDYMVPAHFVTLEALPLTPSGKLSRAALPEPADPAGAGRGERTALHGPVEELLAGIWAELLGVPEVGAGDDFFALGGHSLLATQVVSRVRETLKVELPLQALFEEPTLAALAARVEAARSATAAAAPPLVPVPRGGDLPLSFAQQRLWFLDQLEPGSPLYNMPIALQASGTLDTAALARSFAEIARRHEALRTVFAVADGQPVQVLRPAGPFPLPVLDLSGLPPDRREALASSLAREEAARPFDLARGPLLRAALLRMGDGRHVALVTLHHIVSDGWSLDVMVREMRAIYPAFAVGESAPLPELAVQYADFAAWQRSWLQGEVLDAEVAYWRERLAGMPPLLELPYDRPRPAVQGFRGGHEAFFLPSSLAREVDALGQRSGTTSFMAWLAVFAGLLGRYTGRGDLPLGTPVANRDRLEVEGLIGFFANTLVLRLDLAGPLSFHDLAARAREVTLGAYAHQSLPFDRLVQELVPARNPSHAPLFQVMLDLQDEPVPVELPGLTLTPLGVETGLAKFDLSLTLVRSPRGLRGELRYDRGLFDAPTVQRLGEHFRILAEAVVAAPAAPLASLPLLTAAERHQLAVEWNDSSLTDTPGPLVPELFAAQAAACPEAVAVEFAAESLTYGELDRLSRRLAHRLRELGVGPGMPVGVCVERGLDLPVAILAVWRAGGAFVPLDPGYPEERLAFLVADSGAPLVLAGRSLPDSVLAGARVLRLDEEVDLREAGEVALLAEPGPRPSDLAYVIYTSGSTGRPKGVMVEHRQLADFLLSTARAFAWSAADSIPAIAPFSFDIFLFELLSPLAAGGRCLLLPLVPTLDVEALVALLGRVSRCHAVPAVMRRIVEVARERGEGYPGLRTVFVGGDAVPADLLADLGRVFPAARVEVLYGPTEATILASHHALPPGVPEPRPLLGRPLPNVTLAVRDRAGALAPIGVAGELYIGGAGVTRGYHGREELTAERYPVLDGERLYRSGDLARRLPDGRLEFAGRGDHQVKVRGFRIELGEVEAALAALADVREAAVVTRRDAGGDASLVAFVVPGASAAADPRRWTAALRAELQRQLPEHMVPAAFVPVAALPLSPNGKLDRQALAALAAQRADAAGDDTLPRDGAEAVLAEIWAEALGVDRVGLHDSFFDLGGHSLLATRVLSRIRAALHADLPLRALFERQTVAELAEAVRAARGAARPVPPIVPAPRGAELPLSDAQQRMWILAQMDPHTAAYHIPARFRLDGALDVPSLARAFTEIARRHEVLRTTFPAVDGRPRQEVGPAVAFALPLVDLTALAPVRRDEESGRLAAVLARSPFDLAAGPLVRAAVLRREAGEHDLLWTMHHVVGDAWSIEVLAREVAALYGAFAQGLPSPLSELGIQYADFAVWQRGLPAEFHAVDLAYWRGRLASLPPALDLPTDRPYPAEPSFLGSRRSLDLPARLADDLRALGRRRSATLFVTLATAFQALLARCSGQSDFGLGFPVAGRDRGETEELIGLFVNTLVLRAELGGDPRFGAAVERQRDLLLEAHDHQGLPFERLVDELAPQRDLARTPLFQVLFALHQTASHAVQLPGLTLSEIEVDSGAVPFDLTLSVAERGPELRAVLEYRADLFDAPTVDRLLGSFAALLAGAAAAPEMPVQSLPLLGEAERHQLLVEWNAAPAGAPAGATLHGLFAEQAARTPEATAVVWGGRAGGTLSYGELDRRANRLAHRLRALGVGPEVPVALCAAGSPELAVGLLGVLKAGGYYLPLDPEYPSERLAFMLADAGVTVLLTQERIAPELPPHGARVVWLDGPRLEETEEEEGAARHGDGPPAAGALPGNAAYVIYTSGSTGVPKGVLVEHAAVVQYTLEAARGFGLTAADRVLQFASPSFDVLIEELFPAWASGAAVVFADRDRLSSCAALEETVASERVTALELPAAFWHEWVHALEAAGGAPPASLRLVLLGCEKPSPDRLAAWERFGIPLIYVFGLTETTITNTICRLPSGGRPGQEPPIGRPVADTEVYLLGAVGGPVPAGVAGELYIGGAGLARGYVNRPDLTAARFVPHPFAAAPGARLYRTGDLGRHLADGRIDFLGRIDHQVKIRGFRVEPGEVEVALERLPGVRQAVVLARPGAAGQRLVAYVVPDGEAAGQEDGGWERGLRAALAAALPSYMVPAAFVKLAALPVDPNGKVDRRALPEPGEADVAEAGGEPEPPRTAAESVLARIWSEVLGRRRVGLHDNFFELGGDSILSLQIIARAHREGLLITPRQLFQHPTVAELAAAVRTLAESAAPEDGPTTGEVPLTPIQRWFFDRELPEPHHWNMPLLLAARLPLDPSRLADAVARLIEHHDALRLRFVRGPEGWRQGIVAPDGAVPFTHVDLSALPAGRCGAAVEAAAAGSQRGFDLTQGPLLRAALFDLGAGEPARLLLNAHHLVVDGVSWRILLDDLRQAYEAAAPLPPRSTSFQAWARRLEEHARSAEAEAELPGWLAVLERSGGLPAELAGGDPAGAETGETGGAVTLTVALPAEETQLLLHAVPPIYRTRIEEALLTAFLQAWWRCTGRRALRLDLEGHGREDLFADVDLSRTVGFFTTIFPVALELPERQGSGEALRAVKEQLRRVPRHGIGYGLLRYLGSDEARGRLAAAPPSAIRFEYQGQLDPSLAGGVFSVAPESAGPAESPLGRRSHALEVNARVLGGELLVDWTYAAGAGHAAASVEALAAGFLAELRDLIVHCLSPGAGGFTADDFPLARLTTADLDALLAGDRNVEDLYPLSGMQEGMLFHSLFDPRQGTYVAQSVFALEGELDVPALEHAWQQAVNRHPVLRSCFLWEGLERPLQLVRRHAPLRWRRRDWRGLAPARQEALLARYLRADRRLGFVPRSAPLMRLALFQTAGQTHRLVLSFHQMVLDGWSLPLVLREVLAAYAASRQGRAADLPAPRPYRDYIAWLEGRDPAAAEAFWRRALAGFGQPTPLGPRASARAGEQRPGPDRVTLSLGPDVTARLATQAHHWRVTLSTVLQGAWALLLAANAGEEEVVFGATVSGRPAELAGVETMVGMFLNTLPVRVRTAGDAPLREWLRDLQERQIEARLHEHAPLSRIQTWSEVPSGQALFDAILVVENFPVDAALREGSWGIGIRAESAAEQAHNPLVLAVEPGREVRLGLLYDRRRFDEVTIHRHLGHLGTLLAGIAAGPEIPPASLPLLGGVERHQVLAEWNDTASEYPREQTVHDLFVAQAWLTPEAPAVESDGQVLTYRELEAAANRLARRLRGLGVTLESPVGLCVDQPAALAVGALGILKAGGVYVPLDPRYPLERLALIAADAGMAAVVTREPLLERLPPLPAGLGILCLDRDAASLAQESPDALPPVGDPDTLAYVMYTSGSTGRPKGVAVTHRNVVRLVRGTNYIDLGPSDRMAQLSNTAFDVATFEVWGALLCGGCLVGVSRDVLFAPQELAAALRELRITSAFVTTPVFNQTVEQVPAAFQCLRDLLVGGEALDPTAVGRALAAGPPARLLNGYGPTEGTTYSTWYSIEEVAPGAATVPIGWPLANGTGYVLDRHGRLLPAGATGELHIGGDGLARGYLNRPDLTAERFVPSPFGTGERLYRTGDLATWRPDGSLDCFGRIDHQVKIRGFRIELGEVEAALAADPRVAGAAVVAREDLPGGRTLVAYFVARPGGFPEGAARESELRASLRRRLPTYMVPAYFVEMSVLPINQNGKVDRRALPRPDVTTAGADATEQGQEVAATGSSLRELLAALWMEVLGRDSVGLHDDFFELGGHSLLATQLVSRMRETFQVELPVRAVFDESTLAGLADLVEQLLREQERTLPPPRIERTSREGELELSFAQQRLWFLEQLEPGKSLFNLPVFLRLSGDLDAAALARSLAEVRRRHEVLRTTFPAVQGRPRQRIAPILPEDRAPLPVCDLGGLGQGAREAEARRLAQAEAQRPFDLTRDEPLRAALVRLGPAEHLLLLTLHHIAADGWSMGVLVREAAALYQAFQAGRTSPLPELPIQYADFAQWQRSWLQGEVGESLLAYWKRQLAGVPASLALPADRPRPQWPTHRGAVLALPLGADLTARLRDLSRREGATLFITLLAGFGGLLYLETGQEDLLIGSAIANRNRVEIEGLIGFFINMLPLRLDLSGSPRFRQLLRQVRQTTLGAYAHQDLPFDRLADELRPGGREGAGARLLQVAFGMNNTPPGALALPGLTFAPVEVEFQEAQYDLTVWVNEAGEGLSVVWTFDADLFDPATIRRLHARYESLLEGVLVNADTRIDLLRAPAAPGDAVLPAAGSGPHHQQEKAQRFLSTRRKVVTLPASATEND